MIKYTTTFRVLCNKFPSLNIYLKDKETQGNKNRNISLTA